MEIVKEIIAPVITLHKQISQREEIIKESTRIINQIRNGVTKNNALDYLNDLYLANKRLAVQQEDLRKTKQAYNTEADKLRDLMAELGITEFKAAITEENNEENYFVKIMEGGNPLFSGGHANFRITKID